MRFERPPVTLISSLPDPTSSPPLTKTSGVESTRTLSTRPEGASWEGGRLFEEASAKREMLPSWPRISSSSVLKPKRPASRSSRTASSRELHIERSGNADAGSVGDVVLGKVTRVLPGLQAAFIDIGQERAAFLHVEDLIRPDDFDAYLAGGRRSAKEDNRVEVPEVTGDEELDVELDAEIVVAPPPAPEVGDVVEAGPGPATDPTDVAGDEPAELDAEAAARGDEETAEALDRDDPRDR